MSPNRYGLPVKPLLKTAEHAAGCDEMGPHIKIELSGPGHSRLSTRTAVRRIT